LLLYFRSVNHASKCTEYAILTPQITKKNSVNCSIEDIHSVVRLVFCNSQLLLLLLIYELTSHVERWDKLITPI